MTRMTPSPLIERLRAALGHPAYPQHGTLPHIGGVDPLAELRAILDAQGGGLGVGGHYTGSAGSDFHPHNVPPAHERLDAGGDFQPHHVPPAHQRLADGLLPPERMHAGIGPGSEGLAARIQAILHHGGGVSAPPAALAEQIVGQLPHGGTGLPYRPPLRTPPKGGRMGIAQAAGGVIPIPKPIAY